MELSEGQWLPPYLKHLSSRWGFPGGSAGKESACNTGDLGLIPGLERSPGEGDGYPLQYSGLENPMDSPWGCKESATTEQLSFSLSSRGALLPCLLPSAVVQSLEKSKGKK